MYVNDLSFNPHDPLYQSPGFEGVQWGIQIFTTRNMYQIDPDRVHITPSSDGLELISEGLRWGGQQQRSAGLIRVVVTNQNGVVTWQIEAQHAEPIKDIKLMLWGLPQAMLDKGWWQPTSRQDQRLSSEQQQRAAALELSLARMADALGMCWRWKRSDLHQYS